MSKEIGGIGRSVGEGLGRSGGGSVASIARGEPRGISGMRTIGSGSKRNEAQGYIGRMIQQPQKQAETGVYRMRVISPVQKTDSGRNINNLHVEWRNPALTAKTQPTVEKPIPIFERKQILRPDYHIRPIVVPKKQENKAPITQELSGGSKKKSLNELLASYHTILTNPTVEHKQMTQPKKQEVPNQIPKRSSVLETARSKPVVKQNTTPEMLQSKQRVEIPQQVADYEKQKNSVAAQLSKKPDGISRQDVHVATATPFAREYLAWKKKQGKTGTTDPEKGEIIPKGASNQAYSTYEERQRVDKTIHQFSPEVSADMQSAQKIAHLGVAIGLSQQTAYELAFQSLKKTFTKRGVEVDTVCQDDSTSKKTALAISGVEDEPEKKEDRQTESKDTILEVDERANEVRRQLLKETYKTLQKEQTVNGEDLAQAAQFVSQPNSIKSQIIQDSAQDDGSYDLVLSKIKDVTAPIETEAAAQKVIDTAIDTAPAVQENDTPSTKPVTMHDVQVVFNYNRQVTTNRA